MSEHSTNILKSFWVNRRRRLATLLLLALLAVALLVGLGSGGSGSQTDPGAAPEWFAVSRQDFDLTILANGELEASEKVEIKNTVEGQTTIVELVKEGTFVKKGDVLARLADDKIKERIEQETLSLEQTRSDKATSEQNMAIKQNEAASAERAAEVKLELARLDMDQWQNGQAPQRRRELALDLEKAKRNLTRAHRDVELSKQLYQEKFISLGELEDDEIKVIDAENALATAQLNSEVYEKYTFPRERAQHTSDVDQTQAELQRTRQKNSSNLAQARVELDTKTRTLKVREEAVNRLKDQLAQTVVHAPTEGLVVYASSVGGRSWRGNPIAQGRQMQFNESLFQLPDTTHMMASLKVQEAMLAQVQTGQQVSVNLEARGGASFSGVITQIGVMPEQSNWMNADLKEYSVQVDLPTTADGNLKPGMRCTGRIMLGHVSSALAVPIQAVFTQGRRHFVYVPAGVGKVRRQSIRLGRAGEMLAEVVDGLSEGDRVLLRHPRPGEVEESAGDGSKEAVAADAGVAAGQPAASPRGSRRGRRPGAGGETQPPPAAEAGSAATQPAATTQPAAGEAPQLPATQPAAMPTGGQPTAGP